MTCFWDGIIRSLTKDELSIIGKFKKKPKPTQFAKLLKSKNKKPTNVLWQNKNLSEKELL